VKPRGDLEHADLPREQRFNNRSKFNTRMKTRRTHERRAASGELDLLPLARVMQVHSLWCDVEIDRAPALCVVRKTLQKVSETRVVVGDLVRVRLDSFHNAAIGSGEADERKATGVVERIEPRRTILTRADSFKARDVHPIVANADQMLIVTSIVMPEVRWGLIDRMMVAARFGGLVPLLCVNKIDLLDDPSDQLADTRAKLAHYEALGIATVSSSATCQRGLDRLRAMLRGRTTVLAGTSGVGKSSLIRSIEPSLDLRVGEISDIHFKGKHTTTSARIFPVPALSGDVVTEVVDTPGVKLFGLWNLTPDRLDACFPDVLDGSAPDWRRASYERIREGRHET
jgi:ribosome biogenesis GTPase